VNIEERKQELTVLAERALVEQMDAPNNSLALLAYFQWLTPYYSFILLLCKQIKPDVMVEIGTECGMGCIHMALGNPDGEITTIDLHNLQDRIRGYSFYTDIHNITMVIGDSTEEYVRFGDESVDLLFIDGDHRYGYAKADYEAWYPKVKPGGLILIDDTQQTEDMERFWDEIKEPKIALNQIRWKDEHRPGRGAGFGVVLK